MTPTPSLAAQPLSPRLQSRAVVALTGLSFALVGLGFSYLDRQFRAFGFESLLWLAWTALGFGAGLVNVKRPAPAGQTLAMVLGVLAACLAVFPGLAMYALPRWICLVLMLVMGARAVAMDTQRDFHLTLTVVFVVSFMVATHGRADWSLWFYLGPAWVAGGLALAWQHAAGTTLPRWIRLWMTLGFIGSALLLAAALFLFAPRPPTLGFGFLPPGTNTPGLFRQGADAGEGAAGGSTSGASGQTGASGGARLLPGQRASGGRWGEMLRGMRQTLGDPFIPAWQRGLIESMLDAAQGLLDWLRSDDNEPAESSAQEASTSSSASLPAWAVLAAALVLLAAYGLWRRRYRVALWLALGLSALLARRWPEASMRLSARAVRWCLQVHGFARRPGQSVREHWSAASVPPLARRWLGEALEIYNGVRFGGLPASVQRATQMRQAARGACDVMLGVLPELRQS